MKLISMDQSRAKAFTPEDPKSVTCLRRQRTSTAEKISSFTMYTVIKNCVVSDDNGKNYAELSKNPLDGWQRKYNHFPCYRQKTVVILAISMARTLSNFGEKLTLNINRTATRRIGGI